MQTELQPFVELKDVQLSPYAIIAFGKITIPATMQTKEMYGTSIWLRDVREPIIVTYEDEDERDGDHSKLVVAVASL